MNKTLKLLVLIALALAVGVVLTLKEEGGRSGGSSAPGRPRNPLPRLIDLGAGKCIPCKKMAPILEEIKKEYQGRLEVKVIDVWKDPAAGKRYGIRLIPTQIFYDRSGKELYRHQGFMGKQDILNNFRRLGIKLK